MAQSRKQTAYRKSRKFGDVHGGRERLRLADNIFRRTHSLSPPGPLDELPVLIEENPSRDLFFPISASEALGAVRALPKNAGRGLTHLWLRRASRREIERGELPLAEFVCGSGVRAVVLYPWRRDLRVCLGKRRPSGRNARSYERYDAELVRSRGWWYAEFDASSLRRFYVEHLLFHEIGHHIDWYARRWSNANAKRVEDAADQYAVRWSRTAKHVLSRIESSHAA